MKLRLLTATALAVLALPAFPAGAADSEIEVGDFFYRAEYVQVDPGDTVTWRVLDGSSHTISSRAGAPVAFDSGGREPGETYQVTFTEPGRYPYICEYHPSLGQTGVVQVGPDATRPVLRSARAFRGAKRVRIAFRLSEDARVKAVFKRKAKKVKTVRTRLVGQGRRSLVYRPSRLVPGRYSVALTATDRERNSSKATIVRFFVPKP